MKNKFWKNYCAYWGVIIGMLGMQFIIEGKIEHFLNKMIVIVIGFVVNVLVVKIIDLIKKKDKTESK